MSRLGRRVADLPKCEAVTASRLGSSDGEREASMTRQMPCEPFASVLFSLGGSLVLFIVSVSPPSQS